MDLDTIPMDPPKYGKFEKSNKIYYVLIILIILIVFVCMAMNTDYFTWIMPEKL
jgi:uncharacterized integral membrane protein